MDALISDLKIVSEQLLPIVGVIVLIFLCILLKKAWRMIEKLTETISKIDPTIVKVDQSIDKVQAPLDTAVKLSHTIDDVHDKTVQSLTKASVYAAENFDAFKDYVQDKMNPQDTPVQNVDTYPKAPSNIQDTKEENNHE